MSTDLEVIDENYNLVSFAHPVKASFSVREQLLKQKTDEFYLGSKNGFVFVQNTYMDDTFKKAYPIHTIEVVKSEIVTNCWIWYDVIIKAYFSPSCFISNPGTGAQRLNIPAELRKAIQGWKDPQGIFHKPTKTVADLTPLDWIDLGNDCKSALTKAIVNAQSKFGVAADIYNKGIVPTETRLQIESAITEILKIAKEKKLMTPAEEMRISGALTELKTKKGNIVEFHRKLVEKFPVFDESEVITN